MCSPFRSDGEAQQKKSLILLALLSLFHREMNMISTDWFFLPSPPPLFATVSAHRVSLRSYKKSFIWVLLAWKLIAALPPLPLFLSRSLIYTFSLQLYEFVWEWLILHEQMRIFSLMKIEKVCGGEKKSLTSHSSHSLTISLQKVFDWNIMNWLLIRR